MRGGLPYGREGGFDFVGGDVTADLLRPVSPLWTYLASDLGRAGHSTLIRFLVPVTVGALAFDLYTPTRPATYPLFVLSVLLGTIVSFGMRYLVNLSAFWLLDIRGVSMAYLVVMGVTSGLYFPIAFLPDWAETLMWATPFPSYFQAPLDILVERGDLVRQVAALGGQPSLPRAVEPPRRRHVERPALLSGELSQT